MSTRRILSLILAAGACIALLVAFSSRLAGLPPLGLLLDPADGLYRTAREAAAPADSVTLDIDALDAPVTIVRDARHVPHIFAESDEDAIVALGYVTAQDRLFQLDFIPRVASGRLAAAVGADAVSSDRFLRSTGMDWGARKNLARIRKEDGIELSLIDHYGAGVNAYLDALAPEELPVEFRLLGYTPDRYTPMQAMRVLQYMTYDLTYRSDDARYARLQRAMAPDEYATLYPNAPAGLYVPIIPPNAEDASPSGGRQTRAPDPAASTLPPSTWEAAVHHLNELETQREALAGTAAEGYIPGKGSNNWAVNASRSATGAPLLAGDMHLSLSLPPIWYEAHLVTPSMNAYGLTVPGAPVLVEAFTDHLGWTFTNTGADQIDHYALEVNADRTQYRYEGEWRDLKTIVDTIHVNRGAPVLDTLVWSHHGPVTFPETAEGDVQIPDRPAAVARRWVAHDSSRTLKALWRMAHATDLDSFEDGLRFWDTPMQNVLYAGTDGRIAIRSTGHLPVRRAGHGRGLLDGSTDRFEWVGRVAFDELPHARDPEQGFLTSSNQKPTGPDYPHYLGHDWRDGYRSLRLDTLLRGSMAHSVEDFKRYHADVDVQQRDVFVPLLADLAPLTPEADSLRRMLQRWDGVAGVDRPEPLVMDVFLERLREMAWDEPIFQSAPPPEDAPFVELLTDAPESPWLDVQATEGVEDGPALVTRALEATADTLEARHGWDPAAWRWGDHHQVLFRHLSQSEQLRTFWRGPFEYPGFASTVSPARGRTATHSASQRIIVDFSTERPTGIGVVPGGQSGNPLSPSFYDSQIPEYVSFQYFDLLRPTSPDGLKGEQRGSVLRLE